MGAFNRIETERDYEVDIYKATLDPCYRQSTHSWYPKYLGTCLEW